MVLVAGCKLWVRKRFLRHKTTFLCNISLCADSLFIWINATVDNFFPKWSRCTNFGLFYSDIRLCMRRGAVAKRHAQPKTRLVGYTSSSVCMPNLKFLAWTIADIWSGSQNSKSRSRDPPYNPNWLNFAFSPLYPSESIWMTNFAFLLLTLPDIYTVSKISKVGHQTPSQPRLNRFYFFHLAQLVGLRAKFEVSSFNRCRDIESVPKFQK